MLQSVNLRDYMLTRPVKVRPDDHMLDAMQVIIGNKISGVCVVDGDANLVGILSELDCLRAVLGAVYNDSGIGAVRDYMATENLVVAHPDEDIVDVAQDMLLKNKRRRPVVENGRLVGQITCRQLLSAVREFSSSPNHP
ncbi:MAG: CBS domain-containing protein [Halioglobus sp.]|nr:CBS domain-containing protein [Halioglobus sp.]